MDEIRIQNNYLVFYHGINIVPKFVKYWNNQIDPSNKLKIHIAVVKKYSSYIYNSNQTDKYFANKHVYEATIKANMPNLSLTISFSPFSAPSVH